MDINFISPLNNLGYGTVGVNILKELDRRGHNVSLFPIGTPQWDSSNGFANLVGKARKSAEKFNPDAPSIRLWHQFELDMFPGRGKRIGWPIFELDTFDDREIHHLSTLDHILVCSQWAKDVVEANGIKTPVSVVPLGVDPNIFSYKEELRNSRPYWTKESTIFINVGKWEKRKGHEELLAAFNAAFNPEDDVELWMINDNPFIGPSKNDEWKRKYVESKMGSHIKFFPRFDTHEQLAKIFSYVDCGVFPVHAEGWNLEIPELMACGAHIIATNYSGQTEYLTKENALLLEPTGKESAIDGVWFHGKGSWATFEVQQLVDHMRTVHNKKKEGALGINMEGIKTAQKFTWEYSVDRLFEAL